MTTWKASAAKSAKNSRPSTSPSPAFLSSVPMNLHPDSLVEPNAAASPPGADVTWGVVIVYDDLPAGKRAIDTLEGVSRQLSGTIPLHPSLWRFDLLEDPDWRAEATAKALPAGLVIISTSSKGDLPAAVRDWVQGCLQLETKAPGALVALLGPADDSDSADSPRVEFLRIAAETAGCGFFAPAPHTANPRVAEAPSPEPARPPHRILLVEDDRTVLEASSRVLVRAGYQVNAVESCQAAWEALQSGRHDLLVTDNQMAGMSGLELVSKARSAQITLPVILASGGTDAEQLATNPWLQPALALPKPFTASQLLETVALALLRAGRDPVPTQVSFSELGYPYHHWGINE